jgi:hypothetical protein
VAAACIAEGALLPMALLDVLLARIAALDAGERA